MGEGHLNLTSIDTYPHTLVFMTSAAPVLEE